MGLLTSRCLSCAPLPCHHSPDDDLFTVGRAASALASAKSGPSSSLQHLRNSSYPGSPVARSQQQPCQQQQQQQPSVDQPVKTARIGAEAAVQHICSRFGVTLFNQLPLLWQHMSAALLVAPAASGVPGGDPQGLIHAMQVRSIDLPGAQDARHFHKGCQAHAPLDTTKDSSSSQTSLQQ